MGTVSFSEAREHFGKILDRVARGETIVITRRGMAVARILPEHARDMEQARRAVANIHALREEIARRPGFRPLTDKDIQDAINEGRR